MINKQLDNICVTIIQTMSKSRIISYLDGNFRYYDMDYLHDRNRYRCTLEPPTSKYIHVEMNSQSPISTCTSSHALLRNEFYTPTKIESTSKNVPYVGYRNFTL